MNTKPLAILRQVDMSNNNIPCPGDSVSGIKEERDILKNWLQKYYHYHITLFSPLGSNPQERTEVLKSTEAIFEGNVYYTIIYR